MIVDEPDEAIMATVAAILFTVGRAPMPVREKIEALLQAAETLRTCAEDTERAELELLWAQS